jgi:hypothetical protein
MAADTPTTVPFVDGASAARAQLSTVDGSSNVAPQTALRANGAQVEAANPLPVADATAGAGIGAPADSAWASGSGSVIALLKGLFGKWSLGHGTAAAAVRVELPTDGTGVVGLAAGSALVGKVGIDQTTPGTTNAVTASGITPRVTATMSRPADNTAYSIGDLIGNSGTANLVVPINFTVARVAGGSGRITGCRAIVTAASGTIVLPAFDLLLFRPESNIPFASAGYPADNAALNITSAAMLQLVGVLAFSATGWRNQAGGATAAGTQIYQTAGFVTRPYAPFNLTSCGGQVIYGLLQAQNTWTPTGIVNTFDFNLDCDQD